LITHRSQVGETESAVSDVQRDLVKRERGIVAFERTRYRACQATRTSVIATPPGGCMEPGGFRGGRNHAEQQQSGGFPW